MKKREMEKEREWEMEKEKERVKNYSPKLPSCSISDIANLQIWASIWSGGQESKSTPQFSAESLNPSLTSVRRTATMANN